MFLGLTATLAVLDSDAKPCRSISLVERTHVAEIQMRRCK
jgi:hypothetical protein